jgi:hypothetical protein
MQIQTTLHPTQIRVGATYIVKSVFSEDIAEISGPITDENGVEFFIVESADGGFDIEFKGTHWDGGDTIGDVTVEEVVTVV